MKKLFLTLALVAVATAAFAQGKVALVSDGASLVTLTANAQNARALDAPLLGQAVGNLTPLPSGIVLIAGLWGGASQASMTLQTTVLLNAAIPAGNIPQTRVALTGIAGIASGTPIGPSTPWFQVRVWDSAFGTGAAGYDAALAGLSYTGAGALFQMNPGPSIAYVLTAPPGVNTTWSEGPIVVSIIPEPSTFALAGLGAAAMLIFRRRK